MVGVLDFGLAARAAAMLDAPATGDLVAAAERALATLVQPSTTRGILVERPAVGIDRVIAMPDILMALRQIVLLARLSAAVETPGRVGVKALFAGPSAGRALPDAVITVIAKRADLHGGSIAAAARVARVLSAHEGRAAVTEHDLRAAVRIEHLKSGSSVQAARWTKTEE